MTADVPTTRAISDEAKSMPFLAHFEDDDDLYTYLDRLNQDGHMPEMASIDSRGHGFIATLTDPDADRVHHVVTDEGGRAHVCEDWCAKAKFAPCTWRPTYPIFALSEQNPATVKREIAKAAREATR